MDRLERLQAIIAASRRRWTEKYGWLSPEECRHPTMQEVMLADERRRMIVETNTFLRQYLAEIAARESAEVAASDSGEPEPDAAVDNSASDDQRNSRPT